jgi:hypothetical protein
VLVGAQGAKCHCQGSNDRTDTPHCTCTRAAPPGTQDDPGFDVEVDRVHALVVDELQALYDRHKAEYAYSWANRPLVLH